MLLCSILGCFFSPMRSRMLRVCVRKWGAQRSREGNPNFYSVSWVSGAQQLAQTPREKRSVGLEPHAESEVSGTPVPDSHLWTHTFLSGASQVAVVASVRTCSELREKWGFLYSDLEMALQHPKTKNLEKWHNLFVLARPSSFFVFFGGAPGFAQNRRFWNRQFFTETTVNVVPNCRGCKTHFCTVGSEISHVRSGSNIAPKNISASIPAYLQEDKAKCLVFFSFFPSSEPVSFYFVARCILLCNKYFRPFFFPFRCFAGSVFFLGVSASDYISSFIFLLTSAFFFLLSFLFVVLHVFLFLLFVVFSSCFSSFSCVYFCDSPLSCIFCFLLSFVFFLYLVWMFLLCVFFLSLFLIFLFSSPQAPACFWKGQPWKKTTISFVWWKNNNLICLPFGDLCENVLCAK